MNNVINCFDLWTKWIFNLRHDLPVYFLVNRLIMHSARFSAILLTPNRGIVL